MCNRRLTGQDVTCLATITVIARLHHSLIIMGGYVRLTKPRILLPFQAKLFITDFSKVQNL